jgi:CubicO group peptidase (beta-lactamase class C family)
MVHGAFGAMGGIVTTGNDYAKWIAYLLKGMQHRDTNAKSNRALWDMQRGGGFAQSRRRPGTTVSDCRVASVYGAGLLTGDDCVLGAVLFHGGGFPGYGSHMLLIPATGTGIFALSNRTHAGPSGLVWDTATTLFNAGLIAPKPMETSAALASAYAITTTIWKSGSFEATDKSALAMNFLMDQSLALRTKAMNDLKKKTAGCDVSSPIKPTGRLSGSFLWPCEAGSIKGTLLLAPTATPQIQSMTFEFSPAP